MKKLKLSENALRVLENRYLRRDENRKLTETPEDLFQRVASNIAQASARYNEDGEKDREDFLRIMTDLDFMPNSPTLMNAGNELQQLAACFVIPVEDTMDGIFDAVKYAALIHKSGGGTGFSFSRLRPKNDYVRTTGGVASGPISFMEVFDAATNTIKQGGKRRGANMGILNVDHPDILDFITCKEDNDSLNNFNISVAVTEEFMEAVQNNGEYPLINPHTGQETKKLKAREVFNLIVEMAHKNGEPGIVFIDRINHANPTPELGKIESTNPCGEQPLLPFEACNLGSINLATMVKKAEDGKYRLDYDHLKKVIRIAVRFLDNVIDMNNYPMPEIREMALANRKIGLGVMGWADLLIKLRIRYDSQEAVELAEKVMTFIQEQAHEVSVKLAEIRGPFPNIEKSIFKIPQRNATLTTIAPTGSISIITGSSSGIEPIFALSYHRNVMDSTLTEIHPLLEEVAREEGFYSPELMKKIAEKGDLQDLEEIPDKIKDIFVTAHHVSPEWHLKIQAAFQKHVDNAVSKTVNFPNQATTEDVAQVFILAYRLACKGVTIYRDGSRESQVLIKGPAKGDRHKRPRPRMTVGATTKTEIGCGKLYITINSDENGICEVFTSTGRGGGCHSQSEATSRLTSLALRSGVPVAEIIHQLRGIRCAASLKRKGVPNTSCPDAIGRAIEEYLKYADKESINRYNILMSQNNKEPDTFLNNGSSVCPDCGMEMEHEGGCVLCRNCGYSKCG